MGQVNVNYDDRTLAGIDRICSVKGLSRTEVMRLIATEAIEAHDAGRLAFQEVAGPKLGGTLNALAEQLRANVVEQDRLLRSTQRHEKRMLDAWTPNAESIRAAEEKFMARITDNNRKSYEPFLDVAKKLKAAFGEAADRMANAQDERLRKIEQRLEAVRAEATAPRHLHRVVFPDEFSLRFLVALASMIGVIGAFVVLLAAANMAWLGVPLAKRMLPTTELICRIIDDRYGVSDCEVPTEYRQGPVRIVDAFRDSVTATLGWAEKNLIEARVWDPAAKMQVAEKTGNMVAATFLHDVNRNNEPQLHVHAVIANATKASDGKWHAVHNDQLYRGQHLLGAIHNAELRARIESLGYETTPARNPIDGAFEIKGVSREAIEAFSTRREEILEALAREERSSPRERELAALATRQAKNPEFNAEQRGAEWQATAERVGFDGRGLIDAAAGRSAQRETVWSRVVEGARGIGAKGLAIAGAMGLTPKDGDPLVPERLGRLEPKAFAAAQAVASAARDLGEREAAFERNDLIRTALERGGPVTVTDIEARISVLEDKGLLIGSERLMTTQSALQLERRVIALAEAGRDSVQPLT